MLGRYLFCCYAFIYGVESVVMYGAGVRIVGLQVLRLE